MALLTQSILNIDNQFQVQKNFSWIPKAYRTNDILVPTYFGNLYVNALYRKEMFQLQINNLGEHLTELLEQLFNQTGVGIFHTVQVITPKVNRIWDGVTTPSGGTNTDINRVRNQIYFTGGSFVKTSYDGNPNIYQVTLDCQET
jgi:hypothetical protein